MIIIPKHLFTVIYAVKGKGRTMKNTFPMNWLAVKRVGGNNGNHIR